MNLHLNRLLLLKSNRYWMLSVPRGSNQSADRQCMLSWKRTCFAVIISATIRFGSNGTSVIVSKARNLSSNVC